MLVYDTVHPRICGEHMQCLFICPSHAGSSPRLRGTHNPRKRQFDLGRFIPASAGNTPCPSKNKPGLAVHPRVCGEHFFADSHIADETLAVSGQPGRYGLVGHVNKLSMWIFGLSLLAVLIVIAPSVAGGLLLLLMFIGVPAYVTWLLHCLTEHLMRATDISRSAPQPPSPADR